MIIVITFSKQKVFDLSSNSLIQIIYDTLDYCIPPLKFVDINLDNYLDVEISDGHTNLVPNYSFGFMIL